MIFWTLLLVSMFFMAILYLIIGYQKLLATLLIYIGASVLTSVIIYFAYPGLYTLDLFAFIIPILILIPVDNFVKNLIRQYVLPNDDVKSKKFYAVFNLVLHSSWMVLGVLILGSLMTLADILNDGLKPENIWSIAVQGLIGIIVAIIVIVVGFKKAYSIILVVGKDTKRIYRLQSRKSKLSVLKTVGKDVFVKPRGIFQENGQLHYIYYIEEEIELESSQFTPYESMLYETIKKDIETFEGLEHSYNQFIDDISNND